MNIGKAGEGMKYTKLKDVKFSFLKARAFQMAHRKQIEWKELEEGSIMGVEGWKGKKNLCCDQR